MKSYSSVGVTVCSPLVDCLSSWVCDGVIISNHGRVKMRKIMGTSLAVLVACSAAVVTAGDVESGLQVGDRVGAFNVKDVTGPRKGTSLCYR